MNEGWQEPPRLIPWGPGSIRPEDLTPMTDPMRERIRAKLAAERSTRRLAEIRRLYEEAQAAMKVREGLVTVQHGGWWHLCAFSGAGTFCGFSPEELASEPAPRPKDNDRCALCDSVLGEINAIAAGTKPGSAP